MKNILTDAMPDTCIAARRHRSLSLPASQRVKNLLHLCLSEQKFDIVFYSLFLM